MSPETSRQLHLPHVPTPEQALAEIFERLVRIESKVTKLCLAAGLDQHGNPRREKRRAPTD